MVVPFFLDQPVRPPSVGRGQSRVGNGVPRYHFATVQLDDNLTATIPKKIAFQLIDVGELVLVKRSPLTVKIPKHKEFHEEQRHLSGKRIPGVSKGLFNGRYSTSGGLRVQVPRSAQNKDYLMTIGWVRHAERKMIEEWDKEKDKQEKDKRKKRKRQRRRMRRRLMRQAVQVIVFLGFLGFAQAQIHSECGGQVLPCTPLWWDTNPEPNVNGYWVYRSDTSCTIPSPEPSNCPGFVRVSSKISQGPSLTPPRFIDANLDFNRTYFYRATAENDSNLESLFSNELPVTWAAVRPSPPGNFRGTETGALLRLDWEKNPPVEQVNAYTVRKSNSQDTPGGIIAHVSVTEYRDLNPGRMGPKFYWVTATNDLESESFPAGPVIYGGKDRQDFRGNPIRR